MFEHKNVRPDLKTKLTMLLKYFIIYYYYNKFATNENLLKKFEIKNKIMNCCK